VPREGKEARTRAGQTQPQLQPQMIACRCRGGAELITCLDPSREMKVRMFFFLPDMSKCIAQCVELLIPRKSRTFWRKSNSSWLGWLSVPISEHSGVEGRGMEGLLSRKIAGWVAYNENDGGPG
jgi:hypothetical protein